MSFKEGIVGLMMTLDRYSVGRTELPASSLRHIAETPILTDISMNRLGALGLQTAESVAKGLVAFGLTEKAPWFSTTIEFPIIGSHTVNIPVVAVMGLVTQGASFLLKHELQNRAGFTQETVLMDAMQRFVSHRGVVESALVQAGFSKEEVEGVGQLPVAIYNGIFDTTTRTKLERVLSPLAVGMGLVVGGSETTGLALTSLSVLTDPLAKALYKVADWTGRRMRAARTLMDKIFLNNVFRKEHLPRTRKSNAISTLPIFSTALSLVTGTENLLGRALGINTALLGILNLVPSLRGEESNRRLVGKTQAVVEAMRDPYYLVLPANFRKYVEEIGSKEVDVQPGFCGLVVRDLTVVTPDGKPTGINNLSFELRAGESTIFIGESGKGKSLMFGGITRVIRSGQSQVVLIEESGRQINLNDFANGDDPMRKIEEMIIIGSLQSIEPLAQVVDLFKGIFNKTYIPSNELKEDLMADFLRGTRLSNSMLLAEINIWKDSNSRQRPMFADEVMKELERYYYQRLEWMAAQLDGTDVPANLRGGIIPPSRLLKDMSDGQRTQMMLFSTYKKVLDMPNVRCVLLDEPVRGLDKSTNLPTALEIIERIKRIRGGIAVGIITQDKIEELSAATKSPILDLDNKCLLPPYSNWPHEYRYFLNNLGIPLELIDRGEVADIWDAIVGLDPFTHEANITHIRTLSPTSKVAQISELVTARILENKSFVDCFGQYWAKRISTHGFNDNELKILVAQSKLFWRYMSVLDPIFSTDPIGCLGSITESLYESVRNIPVNVIIGYQRWQDGEGVEQTYHTLHDLLYALGFSEVLQLFGPDTGIAGQISSITMMDDTVY